MKNLAATGIRSPYRQARSESLHRLAIPAPVYRQSDLCANTVIFTHTPSTEKKYSISNKTACNLPRNYRWFTTPCFDMSCRVTIKFTSVGRLSGCWHTDYWTKHRSLQLTARKVIGARLSFVVHHAYLSKPSYEGLQPTDNTRCTYSDSRHLIEGNVQLHVPTEFTLAKKIPVHIT